MPDWLNPLNKLKFQAAFRSKAPQVMVSGGNGTDCDKPETGMDMRLVFDLDYKSKPGMVIVRPVPNCANPSPFVPMGIFELKKVTDALWLDE